MQTCPRCNGRIAQRRELRTREIYLECTACGHEPPNLNAAAVPIPAIADNEAGKSQSRSRHAKDAANRAAMERNPRWQAVVRWTTENGRIPSAGKIAELTGVNNAAKVRKIRRLLKETVRATAVTRDQDEPASVAGNVLTPPATKPDTDIIERACNAAEFRDDLIELHRIIAELRWPDGIRCPKCGSDQVDSIKAAKGDVYCQECSNHFTHRSDTFYKKTKDARQLLITVAMVADRRQVPSAAEIMAATDIKSMATAASVQRKMANAIAANQEINLARDSADEIVHKVLNTPHPSGRKAAR